LVAKIQGTTNLYIFITLLSFQNAIELQELECGAIEKG